MAENAKSSLGLGREEPSPGAGADQFHLLADGLLTESEEASLNGGGRAVQAGVRADGQKSEKADGRKGDGRKDVPESEGGEAPRSPAIPAAASRKRRSVPIQLCNCNDPNARTGLSLNRLLVINCFGTNLRVSHVFLHCSQLHYQNTTQYTLYQNKLLLIILVL